MTPFTIDTYHAWLGVHIATVTVSLVLFLLRFALDQRGVYWRQGWPWLRWAPHVNDTLLLIAGVELCLVAGWRPWAHGWLGIKLVLLVIYILAGKRALEAPSSLTRRQYFGALALSCAGLMVGLALFKPL